MPNIQYPSVTLRIIASLIDVILLSIVLMPFSIFLQVLLFGEGGTEVIFNKIASNSASNELTITDFGRYILGSKYIILFIVMQLANVAMAAFVIILFWVKYSSTPGKMLFKCKIVRKKDMQCLTLGNALMRMLGYFLNALTLFLGLIIIEFTSQRRALHDYIAGTIVIIDKGEKSDEKSNL